MYDAPGSVAGTDYYYGQATDDGNFMDVEFHGPGSEHGPYVGASDVMLAWLFVVLALVLLWLMGAGLFKGSNHS